MKKYYFYIIIMNFNPIYANHSFNPLHLLEEKPKIKYISLEGGGLRGVSHLGGYKFLKDANLLNDLVAVSGSSIGAFMGLLIVCNADYNETVYALKTVKVPLVSISDLINIPYNLIYNWSLVDNGKLIALADTIYSLCRLDKDITFIELFNKTKIELTFGISNVSREVAQFINYKTVPNGRVYDYLIMSSSIPLVFPIKTIDGELFVDGGIYDETGYSYIRSTYGENEAIKHGLVFYMDVKYYAEYKPVASIFDYLLKLTMGTINAGSNKDLLKENTTLDGNLKNLSKNVIQIVPPDNIPLIATQYTELQVDTMLKTGYDSVRKHMNLMN